MCAERAKIVGRRTNDGVQSVVRDPRVARFLELLLRPRAAIDSITLAPRSAGAVDFWLYYTLALLLICGGGLCWLSNLFSLPGNWILLGLVGPLRLAGAAR